MPARGTGGTISDCVHARSTWCPLTGTGAAREPPPLGFRQGKRSVFLEDHDEGDDEDDDDGDDGDDAGGAETGLLLRGGGAGDGPGGEDGELAGHAVDGDLVGAGDGAGDPEDDLLAGAGGDADGLRLLSGAVDHEGDGL